MAFKVQIAHVATKVARKRSEIAHDHHKIAPTPTRVARTQPEIGPTETSRANVLNRECGFFLDIFHLYIMISLHLNKAKFKENAS